PRWAGTSTPTTSTSSRRPPPAATPPGCTAAGSAQEDDRGPADQDGHQDQGQRPGRHLVLAAPVALDLFPDLAAAPLQPRLAGLPAGVGAGVLRVRRGVIDHGLASLRHDRRYHRWPHFAREATHKPHIVAVIPPTLPGEVGNVRGFGTA